MFVWHIKSLVRFIQTTTTNNLRTIPKSTMSSTANAVAAKLAECINAHKQLKERRRQLELEAEQEHLEEERLAKDLEEVRVEEERKVEEAREIKRPMEEWRKQEEEAKATKVFAQKEAEALRKHLEEVKKKKELKRSRPESEMEVEAELEKEKEEERRISGTPEGQRITGRRLYNRVLINL